MDRNRLPVLWAQSAVIEAAIHPQTGIELDLVEKAIVEHDVKACINYL